jgi:hypothetical protein
MSVKVIVQDSGGKFKPFSTFFIYIFIVVIIGAVDMWITLWRSSITATTGGGSGYNPHGCWSAHAISYTTVVEK